MRFYLVLAAAALWLRPKFWKAMLAYISCAALSYLTVEAPEAPLHPRIFPMFFALAGIAISSLLSRVNQKRIAA